MANVDTVDPGGKTVTPDEEVQLREENRLLQGKVRGYATLGKILKKQFYIRNHYYDMHD